MMRSFTFITYDGEDAGEVLCTIMNNLQQGNNEPEVHKIEARTQIGFRPNDQDTDEEGDADDDE